MKISVRLFLSVCMLIVIPSITSCDRRDDNSWARKSVVVQPAMELYSTMRSSLDDRTDPVYGEYDTEKVFFDEISNIPEVMFIIEGQFQLFINKSALFLDSSETEVLVLAFSSDGKEPIALRGPSVISSIDNEQISGLLAANLITMIDGRPVSYAKYTNMD